MTIINKGILDTEDLYERRLSNDWPVAQRIFTAEVVESTSNLYYTNARVQAYLDDNNVSGGGGTDLTGNTTTDLAEGDNLYYTNSRVLSYLASSDVSVLDLTVAGNLIVQGSTTSLESTSLVIEDKNIVLANGAVNAAAADGAGITIDGAAATITYNSSSDKFIFNKGLIGNVTGQVSYIGNHSINALSDVDITGVQTGYTLLWDGGKFTAELGANIDIQSILESAVANLDIDVSNLNINFANVSGQVSTISNWNTSNLAEGVNLYYTNARVLAHLAESNVSVKSITTTETGTPSITSTTSINLSANSSAGGAVVIQNSALRIKSYTTVDRANLTPSTGDVIYNTSDTSLQVYKGSAWSNVGSLSSLTGFDTDDLTEGSNLYYTNTRVQSYLDDQGYSAGGAGGTDLTGNTTTDLAEGNNLYYTNIRVQSYLNDEGYLRGNTYAITATQTILESNTLSYNLNANVSSEKAILVSVNGLVQIPVTDYTVNVSVLTFNSILPPDANIEIRYFGTEALNAGGLSLSPSSSVSSGSSGRSLVYSMIF